MHPSYVGVSCKPWLAFYHGVFDTFDAVVTSRGVGACRKFVYTEGKGGHSSGYGVLCKPWLVFLPWCGRQVRRCLYH